MTTRETRASCETRVRAIRGATTVAADEPALVLAATRELLAAMLARNGVAQEELISAVFTVTADLTAAFPARAVEIPVPDALPRCVRVLLHVHSARARSAIAHVYLHGATVLRPDLARVAAACEEVLAAS